MEQLIRIGLDTSKRFFQLHGVDADGLIVRSVTGDTPRNPVADKAASPDWNSRRGNHLGQRRSPHQQAEHMDASERQLKKSARSTCKSGAVHTWIASSPG